MSGWQDHLVIRRRRPLNAAARSPDAVSVTLRRSAVTFRGLDAGVHAALLALDTESVPIGDIVGTARKALAHADIARLVVELRRLYARDAFTVAVEDGDGIVCELSASSALADFALEPDELEPDGDQGRYRLSRFALIQRADDGLLVESLAAMARLATFRTELGAVLAALHEPLDEAALAKRVPTVAAPVLGACLKVMRAGGVVGRADENGLLPEDREPGLAVREPHDLLLHNRSRIGLTAGALGGTYRFAGVLPALPAVRHRSGEQVPLPRPDLDRLMRTDMPLTAAMERRRSRREWADRPLSLGELGEFLYRVFRVKAFIPQDPDDPRGYDVMIRPIPSGGGTSDVEVYIAAGRIAGLGRGIFHYDPAAHALSEVTGDGHPLTATLGAAGYSSGCAAEPPAVVVLASRFGRLAWKYEGIAYSVTLKNVGVAYAAMYLAATAMGLAGCALGAGDSAAFGAATRARPQVESSVGEFMIGPAGQE